MRVYKRVHIIKMTILHKLIYKFYVNPNQNSRRLFLSVEIDNLNLYVFIEMPTTENSQDDFEKITKLKDLYYLISRLSIMLYN